MRGNHQVLQHTSRQKVAAARDGYTSPPLRNRKFYKTLGRVWYCAPQSKIGRYGA
jgi:hypothetical protein